jgi:polyisoprenoid-binding protein YceI
MKNLNLLALIIMVGSTLLWGAEYRVDREKSMVTFKIRHAVVAKVEGRFNEFSGTYNYDKNSSLFSSFVGEVKMESVDTDDTFRDAHLKVKVFNIAEYPTMELKLIQQDGNSFVADLTIKGITKRVELEISLLADNEKMFILSGEINRKDFNLNFSDMAEVGGIVVGNSVEINILFTGEQK